MESVERNTAVGVFDDRGHAHYAVELLLQNGFLPGQIGVMVPDEGGIEVPRLDPGTKAPEGAAAGAVAGLALGGLLGAALATFVIPGVGPVIAGGIMAGVLGGAAAGAAGGTVVGALIGLDIPEHEAKNYARAFHSGNTLVTVRADDRYDEAVAILQQAAERPEQRVPGHGQGRGVGSSDVSGEGDGGTSVIPGL